MNDKGIKYGLKAKGEFRIKSFDKEGVLIDERHDNNLIVTSGLNHIVQQLFNPSLTTLDQVTHLALGSGEEDEDVSDVNLSPLTYEGAAVVGYTRAEVDPTKNPGGSVTLTATFGSGFAAKITEFGLFTAETGGTMFNRAVINEINKQLEGSVEFEITISLSSGQ